eukprot:CAMPEP_0114553296 /NCGR_PEP_ID=MMETSP0114-20121206/7578_1 /TAXON_ID=31324 /ORGANISM="Goniomonas sp, Strain m" /LENGTH=463 /DNA_ID=CAMNT_0001738221 /DNA_START=17 /DNA_END=1408 /DNA_ORIENTATION=-
MVASEQVGLDSYGTIAGLVPRPSQRRNKFLPFLLVGVVAVGLLVAAVWVSSAPESELSSEDHSDMLEPYYAWQAERAARLRDQKETATLSINFKPGTSELDQIDKVKVGKSSIHDEMIQEFRDRDLLKSLKAAVAKNGLPKGQLASTIEEDAAKVKVLEKSLKLLKKKQAAKEGLLRKVEKVADPLLRNADHLYEQQRHIQSDAEYSEKEAKAKIAQGKGMIEEAEHSRQEFLSAEVPIEAAESLEHQANIKYRADALRYANQMVRAESMVKDPKLKMAAEKKLQQLRDMMNKDDMARIKTSKKLMRAQAAMHVSPDLTDFNGLKERGSRLIHKGERLANRAKGLEQEAASMHPSVVSAQSVAAKAEAKVQERREALQKVDSKLAEDKATVASLKKQGSDFSAKLDRIEQREVSLRREGAHLGKERESLHADIAARENRRAQATAKMQAKNSKKLKSLLAQDK